MHITEELLELDEVAESEMVAILVQIMDKQEQLILEEGEEQVDLILFLEKLVEKELLY